jgi:putative transposase
MHHKKLKNKLNYMNDLIRMIMKQRAKRPKTKKAKKIYRTEHLHCPLNLHKAQQVKDLLLAWSIGVKQESREAWNYWERHGTWRKNFITQDSPPLACFDTLGTSFGQMCFSQVNDAYQGFLTSIEARIKRVISKSTFYPMDKNKNKETNAKHQLHSLNVQHAWCKPLHETVYYGSKDEKQPVDVFLRQVMHKIYKYVLKQIKKPDFSKNLYPKIDQRKMKLSESHTSTHFAQWIKLSTLVPHTLINLPLVAHARYTSQKVKAGHDKLTKTIQLLPPENWRSLSLNDFSKQLKIGVFLDFYDAFEASRKDYQPYIEKGKTIALDKGLCTLLASDEGDLLGRNWKDFLLKIDEKLVSLSAYRQKHLKEDYRYSYREKVLRQKVKGYLTTEVNRIFNQLIKTHHPAKIILEQADFFTIQASKRMNRLLRNMGERIIKQKLESLKQEYGITVEYREAAYSSQECSACGYIDKRNRVSQAKFCCLACGFKCHADVNGARVIKFRRSETVTDSTATSRKHLLLKRIEAFQEQMPWLRVKDRASGLSCDPRLSNPYFSFCKEIWMKDGVIFNGLEKERFYVAQQYKFSTLKAD